MQVQQLQFVPPWLIETHRDWWDFDQLQKRFLHPIPYYKRTKSRL